jgi:penicillin-binding protein 1C
MDPESVFLVTDILSDNAARARAFGLNSPFHLPFDFAAKTGTTKDYRDNWSMGFTPDWTIGVWVGNFDGQPMRRISGITGAGPLLRDAAIVMEKRYGSRPFSRPRRIQDAEICPESGLLPGPDCPGTMREVFAAGAAPTRVCPVHAAESSRGRGMEDDLAIQFPSGGDVFRLNPRMPRRAQAIRFRPRIEQPVRRVLWTVDQKRLPGRDREPWWTLEPGRHEVRLDIDLPGGRRVTRSASFIVIP